MRMTPTSYWNLSQDAPSKLLQWKVYIREVTTINQSLTAGSWTELTEYVKEIPNISQRIELGVGQFTSDSFSLNCNDIKYFLVNWSSINLLEVKVTLNIGVNTTMTSDTPIIASGFVDKMSWSFNEAEDLVSFNVESYDEYSNRISGKYLTYQNTRTGLSSSAVLVLDKISGVYLVSATPYLTLQILTYKWSLEDGYQIKYNDGEFTTITEVLTIRDASNRPCSLYVNLFELEKVSVEQNFIFRSSSDSLPYLFYSDITLSELLTKITDELPVVSVSTSVPTFSPYDSGYRLNSIENASYTNGHSTAKCIEYSSSTGLFYISIGNRLYSRTVGGVWSSLLESTAGYVIRKIYLNQIASNKLWVLLCGDSDVSYLFGRYNFQTDDYIEVDSERLISNDDIQKTPSNFFAISTGIYYCGTDADDSYFLDFSSETISNLLNDFSPSYTVQKDAFSFNSTNYGFYALVLDGSIYKFLRATGSTLITTSTAIPSKIQEAIVIDNGATLNIYYTSSEGLLYRYSIVSGGTTATNTQLNANITAYGLYKSSSNIYFYGNASKSSSTFYSFGYIDTSTDILTTLSNTNLFIANENYKVKQGSLVYYSPTSAIVLITPSGRLMQFAIANTGRIEDSYLTIDLSLKEILGQVCSAYNLIYISKPNKTLQIFPRSNSSGDIQTNGSASNLSVSTSNLISIDKKFGDFGKATKIKLISNDFTGTYNGTNYDVIDVDNEKIIEINSNLIQHSNGYTLRDMAKHYYPFYTKSLNVLTFHYSVPAFQYEVTDGATIDLSGTKLNYYGSQNYYWNTLGDEWELSLVQFDSSNDTGLIQSQVIHQDGTMEVEVLI